MIKDVKKEYTEFHKKKASIHNYPTEWVIRTMLGTYPKLKLDKSNYKDGKILDLGFGDCRNMSLLNNCGLEIYGVETTKETIDFGYEILNRQNIKAELRIGANNHIPFDDGYFNYVLASSSCYYIDDSSSFSDNLSEIARVLNVGGSFIANFPAIVPYAGVATSFILENAISLDDNHVIIQSDIYGIRNGYKFKIFKSEQEIQTALNDKFENISIGLCMDNYYGVQINYFIVTAQKK